jgi:signal transduction histidine kinase
MKIPGWIPKDAHTPLSAKREALLLAVLYLLNCFSFSSWSHLGEVGTKPWLLLVWLYGLAMLVPLVWRDRAPMAVFTAQWVLTVAAWPIMPEYTPVAGIPIALYAVSVHCSRRTSLLALLASFIPNGIAAAVAFRTWPDFSQQISVFTSSAVFLVLVAVGAWGAGCLTQASELHVQHLEHEQEVAREAEVLAAERRRIARELHDIVSHAVTVIVLQAAGAARIADTNFTQVIQSLAHIETTAKQTMTELRRLLGVLEASDCANPARDIDEFGPQPGLANLTELLTSFRATGMPVTLHTEGTPGDLDPSVDLTAYRIVQEGLTNVLKHAGKHANPQLWLIGEAHSLLIQIDNGTNLAEANRRQVTSVGHGLAGLHERAQAVGGELRTGPHHGGGYRLTATLPLATSAARGVSSTTVARACTQGGMDQGKVWT